ncbi:MAG: hypothetical protein Q7V56_07270 [Gammaproteobacteria bacterium]|nr:hypothetical protein [Gammaproteobacteria bacterium]
MDEELKRKIASVTIDSNEKLVLMTTKDMIWKQLNRDNLDIEKTFDSLFKSDIDSLSELYGEISGVVLNAIRAGNELQRECGILLLNALSTFMAAVQIFRSGHRLSSLMLIRSIVELLCVVNHLTVKPGDLKLFQKGHLKSTKCVTTAKKVFPPIGELYGQLSDNITHVAELHRSLNPISKYTSRDEAVSTNFGYLRASIWLVYVTAELSFFDLVSHHRYWREFEGKGYSFSPAEEVKSWMDTFLQGEYKDVAS